MKKRFALLVLLGLATSSSLFASVYLQSFASRAVREGRFLSTNIDSLKIATEVNSGLATSTYTMVVTPDGDNTKYYMNLNNVVDTAVSWELVAPPVIYYDSIEITLNFSLPTDFVADSMWLWVDGKPVEAAIQDRALASQQYQQIVGVRKDPALLEFRGNGVYSLRIFPAKSLKSRKIAIKFNHTFDDDRVNGSKGLIAAAIPLVFNGNSVYNYQTGTTVNTTIKNVEAIFSAADYRSYTVQMPGIGEGTFSTSKTLVLSGNNVAKLDSGVITTSDPSGKNEFLWVGRDPKSELFTAGLSVDLSEDNLLFEKEPETRIICLDVRNNQWDWNSYYALQYEGYGLKVPAVVYDKFNVWERAQKYAVLTLQQYLKDDHKFNVVIGGKTVTSIFPQPVVANEKNINAAITAIIAALPSGESSTNQLLKEAIEQAPTGIAILISDLFQPARYNILDPTTKNTYIISSEGQLFDKQIAELRQMVLGSQITLFTMNENWQISQLALETGGFNIAGLINRFDIPFKYEVIDGNRAKLPELPPLFGSNNGSGLRHLVISSEDLNDLVYTFDNTYRYYGSKLTNNIVLDRISPILAKTKMVVAPGYPAPYLNAGRMLIAGRIAPENSGKPVTITVKGKLDGLRFSRSFSAYGSYLPITSSYRPAIDPQWAFRTSEMLAFDNYAGNAKTIKAIGREYHIVTQQTSLLALEPGMELWEDTLVVQPPQNTQVLFSAVSEKRVSAVADQALMAVDGSWSGSAGGSGVDLDGVSLENLLRKNKIAVTAGVAPLVKQLSVKAAGNIIYLSIPAQSVTSPVSMSLFDLKGRVVASRTINMRDVKAGSAHWDLGNASVRLSKGIYSLRITSGSVKKIFRITLIGK